MCAHWIRKKDEHVRKKNGIVTTPEYYPVIIISDTHLGMSNGATDLLCEFLRHTKCDKLILNGDIVDGYRLSTRPQADFPEGQKRVLDAINRKIAEGTAVVYIPGNHDIELRRMDLSGQTIMGMLFENSLDFTDPKGRRFFIAHGDIFDSTEVNLHKIPTFVRRIADRGYVAMTGISSAIDGLSHRVLKRHFKLLSRSKKIVHDVTGSEWKLAQGVTDHARKNGYDGVICGHFHAAALKTMKDGILYLNSGDWVESFTGLALDKNGDWNVIKWPEKRRELGLKRHFRPAANDNPDKEFRPATEKMLAAIKNTWPGRVKKPKPQKHTP